MNSKFYTLTFLFILFPLLLFSQAELLCGFNDELNTSFTEANAFSHSTDPEFLYAKEPKVFRVKFWQVNQFNGQFGDDPNQSIDISVEEALSAIANLNISFNKYNLFFKYNGLDQFNSPETVYNEEENEAGYCIALDEDENGFNTIENRCQKGDLNNYALDNGYASDENINIYLPYAIIYARATASYNHPRILITRSDLENQILIHEMGHVIFLKHTHRKHIDYSDPLDINNDYTACEHVTRETNDADYNAENSGDNIIDTAAVPDFAFEHYYELLAANGEIETFVPWKHIDENCEYSGSGKDCLEEPYVISPEDAQNTMSYTKPTCLTDFTIGQAIRMHEIVELWPQNYSSILAELPDLFEPYSGEYYVSGPQPTAHPPLFQPGFEYRFIECEGDFPAPADYGTLFPYDTNTVLLSIANDESEYTTITHPNHSAILIKHNYGDFLNKAEKCYNNFNKNALGGSITKFNDNVFNTNVTIIPQDSTSINNQNLIQNLETGLYKIEKNYEDGAVEETIIIKENN